MPALRRPACLDRRRQTIPARVGPATPIGTGGRRVGLLGGSFNPAHAGHLHVSRQALVRLGLHQVWWLVSPQNPLKSPADMAPFAARLARARVVAAHPALRVSDVEHRFGTRRSLDTLTRLRRRDRRARFVWLIGADNLRDLHRWHRWQAIFATVPIAVFARPPYSRFALMGKAARWFGHSRLPSRRARQLPDLAPPAWVFLPIREHPESGTRLRSARSGRAVEPARP